MASAGAEIINNPFVFTESGGTPGIDRIVANRINRHLLSPFSERLICRTAEEGVRFSQYAAHATGSVQKYICLSAWLAITRGIPVNFYTGAGLIGIFNR